VYPNGVTEAVAAPVAEAADEIEEDLDGPDTELDQHAADAAALDLQQTRNIDGLERALRSLEATKIRTGAPANRVDLHRAIQRFKLGPIDAAELEGRADELELLAPADLENPLDSSEIEESVDVVKILLEQAGRYKLLRPDEHIQLARAIALGKSAAQELVRSSSLPCDVRTRLENLVADGEGAFDKFVRSNIRLVVNVAKTYLGRGLEFADLIQEGCLGLMRAVELFDPDHGTQFSTYAYWWINQALTRAIADKSRLVRLPVHAHDALNRIRRARRDLIYRFGREPTFAEISEHVGIDIGKVVALTQWLQHPLALDSTVTEDGAASIGDFIADSPEYGVEPQVFENDLTRLLQNLLSCLPIRDADVIALRFGLNGGRPMTLEEIGQKYGVTRERIRQIEAKSLKRLRYAARKAQFQEYFAS
jgi:RNA polymerase primary sigma factor